MSNDQRWKIRIVVDSFSEGQCEGENKSLMSKKMLNWTNKKNIEKNQAHDTDKFGKFDAQYNLKIKTEHNAEKCKIISTKTQ